MTTPTTGNIRCPYRNQEIERKKGGYIHFCTLDDMICTTARALSCPDRPRRHPGRNGCPCKRCGHGRTSHEPQSRRRSGACTECSCFSYIRDSRPNYPYQGKPGKIIYKGEKNVNVV